MSDQRSCSAPGQLVLGWVTVCRLVNHLGMKLAASSTQPSLHRLVKWVSAFGLSDNKWWLWMYWSTKAYRLIRGSGRLAWSKGWQPPGTRVTFARWTGWTLAIAVPWRQHHEHCLLIIIISPPGSDSLWSGLKFYCRCFFYFNAKSQRCVGRSVRNFALWSVLGWVL